MNFKRSKIVVVGAGLAGLSAAYHILYQTEFDVVVYERKRVIPRVVCACGVIKRTGERFGMSFKTYEKYVLNEVRSLWIHSPSGHCCKLTWREPYCFIIDRERFERDLARRVERLGGEIVCGVQVRRPPADSYVAVASGISRFTYSFYQYPLDDVYACAQATCLIDWPHDTIGLFLGSRFAPRCYAWVFPYGRRFHVGLGAPLSMKINPKKLLEEFLTYLQVEEVERFGYKPVAAFKPPRKVAWGRYALLGDAGGFCDPLTGEGIAGAYASGKLLAKALFKGSLGKFNALTKSIRRRNAFRYRLKQVFYGLSDAELDDAVKRLSSYRGAPSIRHVSAYLLKQRPKLFMASRTIYYLARGLLEWLTL